MARLRRLGAIEARRKRKFRLAYRARNSAPAAPNLMVDVTFIPTRVGWLYLAVLIDLHTRLIVGWSMKDRPNRELVNEALLVVSFEYAVRGGVHGGKAFSCVLEGPRIWRSSYKLLTDTGAVKVRMIFGMLLTSRSHSVQAIVSE